MSIKNERDTTPNYGLIKPKQTDFYNVDDFNENMSKIDGQIKVNADGVADNSNQIKNLSEADVELLKQINVLFGYNGVVNSTSQVVKDGYYSVSSGDSSFSYPYGTVSVFQRGGEKTMVFYPSNKAMTPSQYFYSSSEGWVRGADISTLDNTFLLGSRVTTINQITSPGSYTVSSTDGTFPEQYGDCYKSNGEEYSLIFIASLTGRVYTNKYKYGIAGLIGWKELADSNNTVNYNVGDPLSFKDRRGQDILPTDYTGYKKSGLNLELMDGIQVGLTGGLCHVITTSPWNDTSGGVIQHITHLPTNTEYTRQSATKTTWSQLIPLATTHKKELSYTLNGGLTPWNDSHNTIWLNDSMAEIHLMCHVNGVNVLDWNFVFCTLPEQARPKQQLNEVMVATSNGLMTLTIFTNGNISRGNIAPNVIPTWITGTIPGYIRG